MPALQVEAGRVAVDRRAFWKQKFEEAFRAGDKAGMVEAEKNLEAWTLYQQIEMEERERKRSANDAHG